MLHTPHPLREKLTLFWHNHFATSIAKVRAARLMLGQNAAAAHRHALGKLRAAAAGDVAATRPCCVWLDSNSNVKGKPNENYARELMELFSLGVGNYTEKDIREAARAFTGWHTDGGDYVFNAAQHDGGSKTVLGQTGDLGRRRRRADRARAAGSGAVPGPQALPRLRQREAAPPDALLEPLAVQLRRHDYEVAPWSARSSGRGYSFRNSPTSSGSKVPWNTSWVSFAAWAAPRRRRRWPTRSLKAWARRCSCRPP